MQWGFNEMSHCKVWFVYMWNLCIHFKHSQYAAKPIVLNHNFIPNYEYYVSTFKIKNVGWNSKKCFHNSLAFRSDLKCLKKKSFITISLSNTFSYKMFQTLKFYFHYSLSFNKLFRLLLKNNYALNINKLFNLLLKGRTL